MLLKYVDKKKTTIAILKDWRNQHRAIDSRSDRLIAVENRLTKITPGYSDMPGGGSSGNRVEDTLVKGIDEKDAIKFEAHCAMQYIDELEPYWDSLTDEERYLLRVRFIEDNRESWVNRAMERCFISRSEAYKRSDAALSKLANMLFRW